MFPENSKLTEITEKVSELKSELEMLGQYDASLGTVNEKVIACYSQLQAFARIGFIRNAPSLEQHRNWLVEQAFWLLDKVKIQQRLKVDLIKQARNWLEFCSPHNYIELRDCLHIYYWLKREGIGINGFPEKDEILTSEQLDNFYRDNRHKVYLALAAEVYTPKKICYPHPFATPWAKDYYDLYSRLLTYPEAQRPIPEDVNRLA